MISSDQATGDFPLSVGMLRCANGETLEFFLKLDGQRVADTEVYLSSATGTNLNILATIALRQILKKDLH